MIRLSLVGLACANLLFASVALVHADKETSVQLYKAGKRKYELGEYEKAVKLFAQAYDEHPAPAYLYNVAQSHLKLDQCELSLEFFKKFISEKPDAPNRAAVDTQIAELEAKCPVTDEPPEVVPDPRDVVPSVTTDPSSTSSTTSTTNATNASGTSANASGTSAGSSTATSGSIADTAPTTRRKFLSASAELGIALYDIGDVVVPATPAIRLAGGLPLEYFGVAFEPHAAIELQTMAYDHGDPAAPTDSTVMFSTLLVGATATYPVGKISVGGDLGFGVFHFSGLKMGNPFIAAGAEQSGSVNAFAFRLGGQVEYDVGGGLAAAFSPAYVIAAGANDLRDEISSISRIELMLGARYRL